MEQGRPAVLVSTVATRELVTGFGSEPAMTAWLRTRERTAGRGPLTEPGVEPPPRLVLEERVLAWLIRHPDWLPPDFGHEQRTALWTAECRHEIDSALRTAGARDGREGYPRAVRELSGGRCAHRSGLATWSAGRTGNGCSSTCGGSLTPASARAPPASHSRP